MIKGIFGGFSKSKEQDVYLRLIEYKNHIDLEAVDINGDRLPLGSLLSIYPNGEIGLYHSINPDFGLSLDPEGKLPMKRRE